LVLGQIFRPFNQSYRELLVNLISGYISVSRVDFGLGATTKLMRGVSRKIVVAQDHGGRSALHLLLDALHFGFQGRIAVQLLCPKGYASGRCNAPLTF